MQFSEFNKLLVHPSLVFDNSVSGSHHLFSFFLWWAQFLGWWDWLVITTNYPTNRVNQNVLGFQPMANAI